MSTGCSESVKAALEQRIRTLEGERKRHVAENLRLIMAVSILNGKLGISDYDTTKETQ